MHEREVCGLRCWQQGMVWLGEAEGGGVVEVLVGGRRYALSVMVGVHKLVGGLTIKLVKMWVMVLILFFLDEYVVGECCFLC